MLVAEFKKYKEFNFNVPNSNLIPVDLKLALLRPGDLLKTNPHISANSQD